MIKDDQNYYDQKNFVRDDWGGQVRTPQSGNSTEVNQRIDVNGSTNKPFPQERNFVINPDAFVDNIGGGHTNTSVGAEPAKQYGGQVKYARREGAPSIYQDTSRYTADDMAAARKSEASTIYEDIDESEEGRR